MRASRRRRTTRSPGACGRAQTTKPSSRCRLERLLPVEGPRGTVPHGGRWHFPRGARRRRGGARAGASVRAPLSPARSARGRAGPWQPGCAWSRGGEETAPAVELLHRRRTARRPVRRQTRPEAALAEIAGIARAFGHEARFTSDPELVDWIVGLNADTLFEDLREDDRRAEIGQWTHFSDRRGASSPATGFRRPVWASPGRSSGCSSATTACASRRRCARSCAASTSAGRAAPRPSAGSPGLGRPTLTSSTPGGMLMRFWLALTSHGLYLHPFGSVITNPVSHARLARAARGRRGARRDLVAAAARLLRRAAAERPPSRGGGDRVRYPVRRTLIFGFLRAARPVRWLRCGSRAASICLRPGLEPVLRRTGSWRAWLAFEQARKHVPAYRAFLEEHGGGEVVLHGLRPDFSRDPGSRRRRTTSSAGRSRSGAAAAGSLARRRRRRVLGHER